MPTPRRSRDLLPVVLMAVFAGVLALGFLPLGRPAPPPPKPAPALKRPVLSDELTPLLTRYGEPLYSSHHEELFVRDFFKDARGGVFVDVGASDYRIRNNTYYLESQLGWSGLAIDPIAEFADGYRQHRPRTKFFAMFVSDQSDERAQLYVGTNTLFSSADRQFTSSFTDVTRTVEAPTITLTDLLAAEHLQTVDFLSIDVELHEPQVLAGFDIDRFLPRLVCIEAHPQVRQAILDYFQDHRYVVLGKYLRADPQNLWFAPVARSPARGK